MFSVALCLVALSALNPEFVLAQDPPAAPPAQATFPAVPLAQKRIAHNAIPYQVDTDPTLIRGSQFGYNQCNSTTGGQESRCQTSYVNDFDDFCLWGPPEKDMNVGDHEGEMVAWCTKPGHGTRLIPGGALTGVQFIRTEAYVQVVGFIDQTAINILKGDWGGEMDPHGADLRGNPLGGLIYSNAWTANDQTYDQVIEWHNFIGGNFFCLKVCDQRDPAAANYCEHIFDRIGCKYNIPNNAQDGTFEHCDGALQDFPGTYTTNGQVMTYTQPHGPIETIPYEPRVPESSNCVSFTSAQVYAALATVTPSGGAVVSPAPTNGANTSAGVSGSAGSANGRTTSGSPTGTGANSTPSSAASVVAVSTGLSLMGVIFSALFLA